MLEIVTDKALNGVSRPEGACTEHSARHVLSAPAGACRGPCHLMGWRVGQRDQKMADDEPDEEQLEAQMETAVDAIREAVTRLLREGEVHLQIVVMAATRVAGGLGAAAALASGQDIEGLLDDLAEALRQAGREQHEMLRAELAALPVAGNA
jgi:hypothetical protein